jgi:hypothetical protein
MNFVGLAAIALLALSTAPAEAKPKPKYNPLVEGMVGNHCYMQGGPSKLYKTAGDLSTFISDIGDAADVKILDGYIVGGRPQVQPETRDDFLHLWYRVKVAGKEGWMQSDNVVCDDPQG